MVWSPEQRRNSRAEYERLYKSPHPATFERVNIPADIVVLDRDPSPCFNCESRGPCRHRPWA